MRPFFSYFGSKWRTVPHYPSPKHDMLIEPFAGSASYATRHSDCDVVLVDSSPLICETWRYLISATPAEIRALPLVWDVPSVKQLDVCLGAQILIGWWLGRGAHHPYTRPSSWMRSGQWPDRFWGEYARNRIASQVPYVKHWRVLEGDYTLAPEIEATWFVDPPYQLAGKKYPRGSTQLDFGELAKWCRTRPGQVVVCENEGANWLPFEPFRVVTGTNGKDRTGVSREVIWTHFTDVVSYPPR